MSSSKAAMQSPWIYTATNDLNTMTNSLKNTNLVDKFHLFGKLPLELRRKIWGFATPPPWLIMRRPTPSGPKGYTRQVPADPHACKESRKEFLYHPDVSKDHPTYKLIPELLANAKAIFVSIEQDTVMVELNYTQMNEDLRVSKRIAVPSPFLNIKLLQWPNLEQIFCIDTDGFYGSRTELNSWFEITELIGIRGAERAQKGLPKRRHQLSYLRNLHTDNNPDGSVRFIQSGPFFLGEPVMREFFLDDYFSMHAMKCCFFSQREGQDIEGSRDLMARRLRDMPMESVIENQ